jgi:predicted nucleic acid-binding protein
MGKAEKRPRIFADANILFSAAYSPGSRAAALLRLARGGYCQVLTSGYAIEEAQRNLQKHKPESLKPFAKLLYFIRRLPEGDLHHQEVCVAMGLDAGDVPILSAAIGKADILVTGDQMHFGRWMGQTIEGVLILSLASALQRLAK